ncbi:serine/threonine-protein kinase pim-2-like [Paralichthys olivaceus]|uniref:serine/threonine-protein kinase pim-2-like n=1 Tax=Paralichthys olivaceus TaxID=8255 RepID=UPI0037530CFA
MACMKQVSPSIRSSSNPPEVAQSFANATKRKVEMPNKSKRGDNNSPEVARSTARATERKVETPSKKKRGDDNDTDPSLSSRGQSSSEEETGICFLSGHYSRADFDNEYQLLHEIGDGGYGTVYAGQRHSDSLPVAIKCMPKETVKIGTFDIDGEKLQVPLEVLFMTAAAGPAGLAGKSAVIQLLDWYDLGVEIFLVMERPAPCVDLCDYLKGNRGQLDEHKAKIIMKQLVEAAIEMHSMNMFHRDLKLENILIQTTSDGPRVRIIDFGCCCYAQDTPYHSFFGTYSCAPPEFFKTKRYEALPTTVWQLGVLLFDLVDGSTRLDTCDFIHSGMKINNELSHECQDLLRMCLALQSDKRATLEQIREHPWLSVE